MSNSSFGTIIEIGDILVSEDVVKEYFACDYAACKGICCVEGDSGAPLREEEAERLESLYPAFSSTLSEEGRRAVLANGFFEIDRDGDMVTPLVPGSAECAFCVRGADGGCLCMVENLCKPASCRLYPIRVVELGGGRIGLNYHRWSICGPAREKGKKEGIRVYEFLRRPLEDIYGKPFYEALDAAAKLLG